MSILKTAFILIIATITSILIRMIGIGRENLVMVYLLGVLFTTVLTGGYIYGFISSILSIMLFNFLFTEPRYTFLIYSNNDLMLLIFLLITALVAGTITSRLQKQIKISKENQMTAELLYEVSRGFLNITGKENIIARGINYIYDSTGYICSVCIFPEMKFYSEKKVPHKDDIKIIKYPINSSSKKLGDLLVYDIDMPVNYKEELVFKTVAAQLAIALDREFIYNERENIRVAMEKEKLRSTLLRSVAHDLRSPLTALSGASTLLANSFDNLDIKEKKKLASDISEEIIWLTNLVENILNMTRINEGQLSLHREYEVVDDVVMDATSHMSKLLQNRNFSLSLPDDVVTIPMDGKLIAQVIINLLDNSIKNTHEGDIIHLSVRVDDNNSIFTVEDTGNGVAEDVKDNLFEGFVSFDNGITDGSRGIGLGLAICKDVITAHGGTIKVEDNLPKGSRVIFTLPMED